MRAHDVPRLGPGTYGYGIDEQCSPAARIGGAEREERLIDPGRAPRNRRS